MANSDRTQRTKRMRVVFGAIAVLCLAGWLLARALGSSGGVDARATAEGRAAGYASTTLARVATLEDGRLVIGMKPFGEAVRSDVSDDLAVARVRAWDASGTLVVSTDPRDRAAADLGAAGGVRAALRGATETTSARETFTPLAGGAASTDSLTRTFVPLSLQEGGKPAGVVEVDFVTSRLVPQWWDALSRALAAMAVVFGVLFVVVARRRTPAAVPIKRVEPPPTAPKIRHDYRAATRGAATGWVAAASDDPPPLTSVADLEAATARIAVLEGQLERAAEETEQARSQAASQEQDMEQLRQEATERVAALEERVDADGPEIAALRDKLAEAESRANQAESLLSTAQEQLAAAHAQVGDTRVGDDEGTTDTTSPDEAKPQAEPEPTDPTDLIAVLEAKVAEAEARAEQAKDEAMQLSPEASDLRMRLARTAARKKMGSAG
jgi:hypothetical protein